MPLQQPPPHQKKKKQHTSKTEDIGGRDDFLSGAARDLSTNIARRLAASGGVGSRLASASGHAAANGGGGAGSSGIGGGGGSRHNSHSADREDSPLQSKRSSTLNHIHHRLFCHLFHKSHFTNLFRVILQPFFTKAHLLNVINVSSSLSLSIFSSCHYTLPQFSSSIYAHFLHHAVFIKDYIYIYAAKPFY